MNPNILLNSNDPLTTLVRQNGCASWGELTETIKQLPYGRNTNRGDLKLVLTEKKGTCSSKHALLKEIADKNSISKVTLLLGMYKMNHLNTPKIGQVLIDHSLSYIPEAHCYLSINDTRTDFTSKKASFSNIESDIIEEIEIAPSQVDEFKVDYHKKYLKQWIIKQELKISFEALWQIREQCIQKLTKVTKNNN